jgi:MoxR-like ATPase
MSPSQPSFVTWFRAAAPYIHAFRGKTFVVAFGGEVVDEGQLVHLSHDVALLASLGVRLVLIHGSRPQIAERLERAGLATSFHDGMRITDSAALERGIYDRKFLQPRPLLDALEGSPAVLLIDELDRADEPFEAFLLEILADFQITIPELGTVKAATPPVVIITSNRTREVHDAVRRRCLYHWVDYPDAARERAILKLRAPGLPEALSAQVVAFVQKLRDGDYFKLPGVAETIDWAQALAALDAKALEQGVVDETLGVLLKYQDDIAKLKGEEAARLIAEARAG